MSRTSLLEDIKGLAGKSVIYGLGSILLKAIGFLLIPVYTRHLSTADFGTMALTSSVSVVLLVFFALELRGAINYFYIHAGSEEERRANNGTIWIAMISISLLMAILLDFFGRPIFALLFRTIPFDPYFRLAIWSTFFTIFGQFPQLIFQVRERPLPYIILLVSNALLNIGLIIYFVVYREMGAYGYLLGILIAAMIMAVPYFFIALQNIKFSIRWSILGAVLAYSIPLVPHSLSSWLLELSDRFILEKFVSLSAIGIYSLGYQFGSIVNLVASAINTAWVPYIFRVVEQNPLNVKERISRLITYYVLALSVVFLAISLFVRELNFVATSQTFHGAYLVAYWVTLAQLTQGLYYIPVNFLFLQKKTKYIPLVTLTSAIVDISLNLLLIPRYGMIAAAWSGFVSKIVMVLVVSLISNKVYPVPYEYMRIGKLLSVILILFLISLLIPSGSIWISLAGKSVLFLLFPFSLYWLKLFTPDEKQGMISSFKILGFLKEKPLS